MLYQKKKERPGDRISGLWNSTNNHMKTGTKFNFQIIV